jgi:NAD(P)-dependent dehydrogenase (short-subunit alcohol dehydrogenase family)
MAQEQNGQPQDFAGRVALITGGSRGIGYGIAEELVARGARVVITARTAPELDDAAKRLGGPEHAVAVRGPADDSGHQEEAVARAVEHFGALDLLAVNAAASSQYGPLIEADLSLVREVMEVNVVGGLGWVQQAWKGWMSDHAGAVVYTASIFGLRPGHVPTGAYNVSKAAVIHLTRQLAGELAPRVRVNAIAPAMIKTDFVKADYEGREDVIAKNFPMGRIGTPEDTAKLAAFLLSGDASWISGETVIIDGGLFARGR